MCKQCVTGGREKRARGPKRKWRVCAALVLRDDVYVSMYELQSIIEKWSFLKLSYLAFFWYEFIKILELLTWLFKLKC